MGDIRPGESVTTMGRSVGGPSSATAEGGVAMIGARQRLRTTAPGSGVHRQHGGRQSPFSFPMFVRKSPNGPLHSIIEPPPIAARWMGHPAMDGAPGKPDPVCGLPLAARCERGTALPKVGKGFKQLPVARNLGGKVWLW